MNDPIVSCKKKDNSDDATNCNQKAENIEIRLGIIRHHLKGSEKEYNTKRLIKLAKKIILE